MAKFLDENGLSYLWSKIKQYVDSHSSTGSGDMIKDAYDIHGVEQDIFNYADGFRSGITQFFDDGRIVETRSNWTKITTIQSDGSIQERIDFKDGTWIEKITMVYRSGYIIESLSGTGIYK